MNKEGRKRRRNKVSGRNKENTREEKGGKGKGRK
jgi:hypothetical protein